MIDIWSALQEVSAEPRPGSSGEGFDAAARLTADVLAEATRGAAGLREALTSGLRDAARRLDHVSLAVTGLAWLGSGVPSVEQEIVRLVKRARREITLCAYSISTGALPLLTELEEAARQGVTVRFVVNDFGGQPVEVQGHIRRAAGTHRERWNVLAFEPRITRTELHAKVLAVDRAVALVGSANLTFHGMVSNHEMALIVQGPTAALIASRLDSLLRETRPVQLA